VIRGVRQECEYLFNRAMYRKIELVLYHSAPLLALCVRPDEYAKKGRDMDEPLLYAAS